MDSFYNYEITSYDVYRGLNALEKFVAKLEEELLIIQCNLSESAEMIMRPGDFMRHKISTSCWICGKDFPNSQKIKTIICNPNNGNYEGASCQKCKYANQIIGPKWYSQPSIADKITYKETETCMYCNETIVDRGQIKVRDHCHISGYYRGPAHSSCNTSLKIDCYKTKIPLICHNF